MAVLAQIWTPALDRAGEELAEMDKLLQKDVPGATFESWDWWYYAEKLRKQNYALDEEMLRSYFSLENVQGGIFYLANRLYGITFQPILRRSPTRCSTPTSRIWACSISTSFRVTARVRGRGAATMSNRPTGTASASLPW